MTDYESVGQGFESLLAYQNGYLRVSVLFYFRDSKIKMQQSGGLLLMPGSTGMTPLFSPIPGRKRKRVPSGVPAPETARFRELFISWGLEHQNAARMSAAGDGSKEPHICFRPFPGENANESLLAYQLPKP